MKYKMLIDFMEIGKIYRFKLFIADKSNKIEVLYVFNWRDCGLL